MTAFPRRRILASSLLLSASLTCGIARAETITLIDGTKMQAEILHAYKGEFTLKTAEGEITVEKSRIKSIVFETPVARAIYSTPEKTLEAWRTATLGADEKGMTEAYALIYQGTVAKQMEDMDFKARSGLVADVGKTKFTVKDRKIEKDKATLTVEQEKDGETRSGEIRFVLENGEWKMTP